MTSAADVVIIGAGFTGLSAAITLREKGFSCIVLEARERVGGRVESRTNGLGERVDTGGQFLCDDMPTVMALARRKTLVRSHFDGATASFPAMSGSEAEHCFAGSMAIRERMNGIAPDDPAIAGLTVARWLATQTDADDAKAAFRAMIEGLWCIALEQLPLWYLISSDQRITNEAHELQFALAETMHSLADDLAADLGSAVWLGVAATRIERFADAVRVTTAPGAETTSRDRTDTTHVIDARATLIAMPPVAASRLEHLPPLPSSLERSLGAWRSGAVIKVFLRYDRPFWREDGLSGMVVWSDPSGLFAFDSSVRADRPALAFFVGGPLALKWRELDESALLDEVKARLAATLGPEAGEPIDVTVRDWIDDRWSGGAYSDVVTDMGATDAEDLLRAGAPPVFFASSELSSSFPGYVEGALIAGETAAEKIAAELAAHSPIATRASGS